MPLSTSGAPESSALGFAQALNASWSDFERSHRAQMSRTNYLDSVDDKVLNLVGVYAIEEQGLKLFNYVESDLFSIQGISMIQLCQFLWDNNLLFESYVV